MRLDCIYVQRLSDSDLCIEMSSYQYFCYLSFLEVWLLNVEELYLL